MNQRIYLDNNATTEIAPEVVEVMLQELKSGPSNPSSVHSFGQEARNRLTKARRHIATFFGVRPSEIIFTSGGTEAINMVLQGYLSQLQGKHVITSNVEHSAVFNLMQHFQTRGVRVSFLPVGLLGAVTPEAVKAALRPETGLISLMAVNNETGVKTDIQSIAHIAQENKISLVVDGVAWMGKEYFSIPDGVSAICFSGHKFHAPKGVGIAVVRHHMKLNPLLLGGGQENERRGGTENLAGIMGIAEGVRLLQEKLPSSTAHMQKLRDRLQEGLISSLSGVIVHGQGDRICNTLSVGFEGVEGESLLIALDLAGVSVSHGSACSSGSLEPSRVLLNMGISRLMASSSLRFSLSRLTTDVEIDRALSIVIETIRHLRRFN